LAKADGFSEQALTAQESDSEWVMTEFLANQWQEWQHIKDLPDASSPVSAAALKKINETHTVGDQCTLCEKGFTSGHAVSKQHLHRASHVHQMNALMGEPAGPRKLFCGLSGPDVSQTLLKRFWGDELEAMPRRAMARLKKSGFQFKPSKSKAEVWVSGEAIERCGLAIVPFEHGTGKYDQSVVLPWNTIPEEGGGGGFEQDHFHHSWQQGQEWWPVVTLTFAFERTEHGWALNFGVRQGGCWIVCIYQLLSQVPTSWWCPWRGFAEFRPPPPPMRPSGVFIEEVEEDDEMAEAHPPSELEPPPEPAPQIPPLRQTPEPAPRIPYPSESMEMID
jgi:hypothetical protein